MDLILRASPEQEAYALIDAPLIAATRHGILNRYQPVACGISVTENGESFTRPAFWKSNHSWLEPDVEDVPL